MGTWAAENFASDAAADCVDKLIDQLTSTIDDCFDNEGANLNVGEDSVLMPSVAIIKLLSEQCGVAPPKPDIIEGWRSEYLAIYDDQCDCWDAAPGFKVERRKVIDDTFTELIQLATTVWES